MNSEHMMSSEHIGGLISINLARDPRCTLSVATLEPGGATRWSFTG